MIRFNKLLQFIGMTVLALSTLSVQGASKGLLEFDVLHISNWKMSSSFKGTDRILRGEVELLAPVTSGDVEIRLNLNGARVATASAFYGARPPIWASRYERWVSFEMLLPGDLPDGIYELEIKDASGLKTTGETRHLMLCGEVKAIPPASLLTVKGESKHWTVTLDRALSTDAILEVWLFNREDDRILQAVSRYLVKSGTTSMDIELPNEGRWEGVRQGILDFHIGGYNYGIVRLPVIFDLSNEKEASWNYKPMAHGIYSERSHVRHYWLADDEFMLWWNGKPWLPQGGMYFLDRAASSLEARKGQWSEVIRSLDLLQSEGFNDLYVNAEVGLSQSKWNVQKVVNEFNERGLHYGWQLTTGVMPFRAYSIRSSASQGLIKAKCVSDGILPVSLPLVPIQSLLIVPLDGGQARQVAYSMDGVESEIGMEIAQILESEEEADSKLVELKIPDLLPGQYYVIVEALEEGKRLSNVWEFLDETRRGLSWISDIDWGVGLRFFVDPICNEGGVNNNYEVVRVASDAFNQDFAELLREKYKNSLSQLLKSWHLSAGSLSDFNQASRLIPLRDKDASEFKNALLLIDPKTGKVFKTQGGMGASWMDYLELVRVSYGNKRDQIAQFIKEKVEVPIVYKRVAPWTALEGVSRSNGGFDGVGLELYPSGGSVMPYGAAAGRMEAELSSHTVWLLATELGYSAKPENLGVRSWPDEQTFSKAVHDTLGVGAKGVFLFGWRLPNQYWSNHALLNQPDRLEWVRNAFADMRRQPNQSWPSFGLAFPEGQSWWWRAGKELWTRYNSVYDGPPSEFYQSLFLTDGERAGEEFWAISTNVPISGFEPVVVNLTDAFYADHYAEDLKMLRDEGSRMIYLGVWPEDAEDPSFLSRHFKPGERLLASQIGRYQPLHVFPDDVVLAQDESGNVWAKLTESGELLIVSAERIAPAVKNQATPSPALNAEWIDQLMGKKPVK